MFQRVISCAVLFLVFAVTSAAFGQIDESVLFVSDRGDGKTFQIYSMAPDGANQKKLTQGDAIEVDPAFSPDGTRIALVAIEKLEQSRQATVVVMNRDGSDRKKLSDEKVQAFAPAWSPDGKRIVYSAFNFVTPSPAGRVFVVDADGGKPKPIGTGLMPSWSADGKQISSSIFKNGNTPTVHVMDTDGGNVKPLTEGNSMMAVWSPDGKRIAYVGEGGEDGSDQPDLFVMSADGSEVKQLTRTPVAEFGPAWSADSRRIYFTRYSRFIGDEAAHIFVIAADGTEEQQLTKGGSHNFTGGSSLLLLFGGGSDEEASDEAKPPADPDTKPSSTNQASAQGESVGLVESKVLKTELQALLAETLKAAREAGEPVPAEMTADKMIALFLPEMRKHRPAFLRVRPDVEKKYRQGEFDDARSRARWKAAVKTLADFNVALPKMHQRLLSADKQRPLSGARLELAAQLFEAQVTKLLRELDK